MYAVIMVRQAVACSHEPKHDRGRRCRGAAVAAVGQRGKGGSAQAVVANLPSRKSVPLAQPSL